MTRSPQDGVRGSHAGIWLAALVLVAAVASALLVGGARSVTPPSGQIAFARELGKNSGIFVMRDDGSGVRLLRRGRGWVSGLAWSPDGTRLAFAQGGELWVMRADGSGLVRLPTRAGKAMSPTWSPDGRRIAFVAGRDIWVMNANGTRQRRLVETSGLEDEFLSRPVEVDWSPSGGRLVVIGLAAYIPNGYVMSTKGTDTRVISRHFDVIEPDWSPGGRRIAFARWLNSSGTEKIYFMRADGTGRAQLTRNEVSDREPSWSPDGRRIAFVRDDPDSREIYVTRSDGTRSTRLTHNDLWEASPAWQPVAAP